MIKSEMIRRMKRWACVLALLLAVSAADLLAQAAVVKRTVILREGPSEDYHS